MFKKIFSLIFLLSLVSLIPLSAETIVLNSGRHFEAKVLEDTKDFIRVDIIGISIKYPKEEIKYYGDAKGVPPEIKNSIKLKEKVDAAASDDSISIKINGTSKKKASASRKRIGNYKRR